MTLLQQKQFPPRIYARLWNVLRIKS